MPFDPEYHEQQPDRDEVDRTEGPVLLEFGSAGWPLCQDMAPQVAGLLERYPVVRHIKVADGRGKPLGRSFGVKLWPTFVFLRGGQVVRQAVRPEADEVREGLEAITGGGSCDSAP